MEKHATAPADAAAAEAHPRSERNPTSYTLSEAAQTSLKRLAAWAPTLRDRELRVLLYLESITEEGTPHAARVSQRAIAKATNLALSNVVAAVAELTQRKLISRAPGTATKPSFIHVHTHSVRQMGVPILGTPPTERCDQERHTPYLFQEQGVPISGTPPTENAAVTASGARVDLRDPLQGLIDRVISAKVKNQNPSEMQQARRWLHGYAAKFPAPDNQNPHPPSDEIIAQFLAIAPWPRLEGMLQELVAERQPAGYSYGWFVTVAMQRIHGVSAEKQKAARQQLKIIRREKGEISDPDFTRDLVDKIAAKSRSAK